MVRGRSSNSRNCTDHYPTKYSRTVLARFLFILLLLEATALAVTGVAVWRAGYGPLAAVATSLALALVWRLAFLTCNFLLSGALSSQTGTTRRMRWQALIGEATHQARLYPFAQMVGSEWGPNDAKTRQDGPVVVLIHGFLCNARVWRGIGKELRRAGFGRVHAVNLDPLYRSIEATITQFERKLQCIMLAEGVSKVVLVGHSMGGVLARIYCQRHPDQIQSVLSIGAPHRGTDGALLIGGREHGPPSRRSQWLDRFNAQHTEEPKLINVWSANDNIVWPQRSAQLNHVTDYKIAGYGHLHMLAAPEILQTLLPILEQARTES